MADPDARRATRSGSARPGPTQPGPSPSDPANADPANAAPANVDPSAQSLWRPLRLLQASLDADIARIYAERQIDGLKPAFVMELLRLHATGPMTIAELAQSVRLTHSAVSQKVAAMRKAGWVRTVVGDDARTRKVTLTAKARRVVGRLAAEWRATEAALAEVEAEIPYPLSRVVTDVERALERRSFHDRIAEKLAEDPAWD